jgi:hypothetical protein
VGGEGRDASMWVDDHGLLDCAIDCFFVSPFI